MITIHNTHTHKKERTEKLTLRMTREDHPLPFFMKIDSKKNLTPYFFIHYENKLNQLVREVQMSTDVWSITSTPVIGQLN